VKITHAKGREINSSLITSSSLLDKFDAATSALKNKTYDKVKAALEEGTGVVSKRIKASKVAEKSEFGWQTVSEYL